MKSLCAKLFLILVLPCLIYSQSIGLSFSVASPQNEFRENVDNLGYGGSANFLFWTPSTQMPFSFGLNIGYFNYGNESRNTRISGDIPDITVDVSRSNNLANFHLMFQISPVPGALKPYAELLFGGEYLYTETKLENEITREEVVSSTNQDDFAWSYGAGGGLQIKLASLNPAPTDEFQLGSVWLDLKVRYLFGTEAEYLKEGSVVIQDGKAFYNVSRSKTDLMFFHLGVVLQIN